MPEYDTSTGKYRRLCLGFVSGSVINQMCNLGRVTDPQLPQL